MNLGELSPNLPDYSIPRVSGGEPIQIVTRVCNLKYSPRERG